MPEPEKSRRRRTPKGLDCPPPQAGRPESGRKGTPPSRVAREIKRRMDALGMNARALSLDAGLGPTYVRDLIVGRVQIPGGSALEAIAQQLACSVDDIMKGSYALAVTEDEAHMLRARRFKSALWATYSNERVSTSRDVAASLAKIEEYASEAATEIGVPVGKLIAYANGTDPIPENFVTLFAGATGCPKVWILKGQLDDMPPGMAARVGLADPTLLPGWDDGE